MSGYLDKEEARLVKSLKGKKLTSFDFHQLRRITENGGVSVFCGDGDIDASVFVRRFNQRLHSIKVFGGPLFLAPSFGGYSECGAKFLLENIALGMEAKQTLTVFVYFHWPCGAGAKHNHSLEDVFCMVPEVMFSVTNSDFFCPKNVYPFFHAKRKNKKRGEEQNTYLINL